MGWRAPVQTWLDRLASWQARFRPGKWCCNNFDNKNKKQQQQQLTWRRHGMLPQDWEPLPHRCLLWRFNMKDHSTVHWKKDHGGSLELEKYQTCPLIRRKYVCWRKQKNYVMLSCFLKTVRIVKKRNLFNNAKAPPRPIWHRTSDPDVVKKLENNPFWKTIENIQKKRSLDCVNNSKS